MGTKGPGRWVQSRSKPRLEGGQSRGTKSDLTPRFKLIFCTVVALTVLALILNVLLAMFGDGSEQVQATCDACSTTYKMGFGAIVALIGGKGQ